MPVSDRWLPNHPKERYGKLPYCYFRTRFYEYGTATYDLPCRSIRRQPEYNEEMWYRVSQLGNLQIEKFFWIGALLPFQPLFFSANPRLTSKGEKVSLEEDDPWGFVYE
ncbi:hypothetical protein [Microseira wollei]|uniref:Uncharacterized protein n=1 Tax=Microseira wollei NIES-4236 TaxID=2530354 RepID=A0AAV3XK12_9CYAN|nr:hypothetical protein [Microseira wollei]GET42998.1 hypothetical protein MiSe_78180 [Microseira wollei NIES-4236]